MLKLVGFIPGPLSHTSARNQRAMFLLYASSPLANLDGFSKAEWKYSISLVLARTRIILEVSAGRSVSVRVIDGTM